MDVESLLNPPEMSQPLSRVLRIDSLLNPDKSSVDVLPLIKDLESSLLDRSSLLVPLEIHNHLKLAVDHILLSNPPPHSTPTPKSRQNQNPPTLSFTAQNSSLAEVIKTEHNIKLNRETWSNPILGVAYSRGAPRGRSVAGKEVKTRVLVDSVTGENVPCVISHSTCQGCKVCPLSDMEALALPHTSASRTDVKERLLNDREYRQESSSPSKDVFLRTLAFLTALQKLGCSRPLSEETFLLSTEEEERKTRDIYLHQIQRGYRMREGICEGRLIFERDDEDRPFICCEHYIPGTSKDHFHDLSIGNGSYDVEYIEACLTGDLEEATRIEEEARDCGYGPLIECTTVANFSTQKAYCPVPHRSDTEDSLIQPLLEHMPCTSKFRVYEPVSDARSTCPFILLVTSGEHTHPVPLPTKTPPRIRAQLFALLEEMDEDLPDLTPRRLLRHPILKAFLSKALPNVLNPTLADWHVSLANRSHLKSYIKQARELHYPFGTGWHGVVSLKAHQDENLPKESHYIRRILAIDHGPANIDIDDEEEEELGGLKTKDDRLRIIICMTPEASRRLIRSGRYLQSDIGFRRIVGFKEFEVASMDRDANTSLIFLRIFLNRMSATAHQRVFEEIEAIVYEDTGKHLRWHHLHASQPDVGFDSMILSWVGDQHRGQAKGLHLHLQKLASRMPIKSDMYQPERNLQDLSPYEHLHRVFRVCVVHYFRLVKLCATTEQVRWLMRSLVCMEHPDWDGTLESIRELGGKPAQDWLQNKLSSGFVFEGICWERSFMPRSIWEAGDSNSNLIETVHRDANREGVQCTLLGGLKKGQSFDRMKTITLQTFESFGITPTYRTGHPSENALMNLKRRDNQTHKQIVAEDAKIHSWNHKLQTAVDNVVKARRAIESKQRQFETTQDPSKRLKLREEIEKKQRAECKSQDAFQKVWAGRSALERLGSGRVSLLDLPMID
ncbi:hypothetical protein R3P38DRAFT_3331676 [Favolaschia claudopus]|uniref:Uncharacterized protein n=1 Tax=Favolaschia claudopus TaxID=2862362 RepID=A0AAV9ZSX8_9AGAR